MAKTPSNWLVNSALFLAVASTPPVLAPPCRADEPPNVVTRVTTSPDGVWVYVDGSAYQFGASLNWQEGSKHTLSTDLVQTGVRPGIKYTFSGWKSGNNPLPDGNPVTV